MEIFDLAGIPLFNQDLENQPAERLLKIDPPVSSSRARGVLPPSNGGEIYNNDNDFQLFFFMSRKDWTMNEEGKFNKSIFWESGFIIDKGEYLEL